VIQPGLSHGSHRRRSLSAKCRIRDNTRDNTHPVQGVQSVQKTPQFAGGGR
jgi:hypothetical protein